MGNAHASSANFADNEAYKQGQGVLVVPSHTPEDVAKFSRSVGLSKLGLDFIFLGGLAQAVSNYMPE